MLRKATSKDSVFLVRLNNFDGLSVDDQVFYRPNSGNCYVLGNVTEINTDSNSIKIYGNTKNIYARSGKILMLTNEFVQGSHDNPRFKVLTNTNLMNASNNNYQINVNESDINTTHLVITDEIKENGKQYFKENQDNEYVLFEKKKRVSVEKNNFETKLILVNGEVFNKNFVSNETKNLSLFEVN